MTQKLEMILGLPER